MAHSSGVTSSLDLNTRLSAVIRPVEPLGMNDKKMPPRGFGPKGPRMPSSGLSGI